MSIITINNVVYDSYQIINFNNRDSSRFLYVY